MRNIFKTVLLPLATLVVGVVSAASIHTAVAGPSASPPYNNVSSPINTGAISQVKKGLLGLGALTTDKLDGYQLFVKGKTKLQGDTDIVGGTRVEGTLNVTQDAYAKQFCLPGDKGGCVNSWDGMGSKIVGAGAMFWDPYRQQSSFYCEKFSWDGTDTYSYKDGKTQIQFDETRTNAVEIEKAIHSTGYRIIRSEK